jgi:hypothetical protein
VTAAVVVALAPLKALMLEAVVVQVVTLAAVVMVVHTLNLALLVQVVQAVAAVAEDRLMLLVTVVVLVYSVKVLLALGGTDLLLTDQMASVAQVVKTVGVEVDCLKVLLHL